MKDKSVVDVKPRNSMVTDVKSSIAQASMETEVYRDPHVLNAGMPIGLLIGITYWDGAGTAMHIRD